MYYDYIKIHNGDGDRELTTDPSGFECFEGLVSDASSGSSGSVSVSGYGPAEISETTEVADAIWNSQRAVIESQTLYFQNIQTMLEEKQEESSGAVSWAVDIILTLAEIKIVEFTANQVYKFARYLGFTSGWAGLTAFLAGIAIRIAINELRREYGRGGSLLETLQEDNTALLSIEQTRANYYLRNERQQTQAVLVDSMLGHIHTLEAGLQQAHTSEVSSIVRAIEDLQYNDDSTDLGGVIISQHGKVIQTG